MHCVCLLIRSAASLLADDSAELHEILGSGVGGAAPSKNRGKMMLMRRGTRIGKLSQLTPDLERRMGEANSAYIGNDFARAVDILLHIIQSAPHALGPYHTLGLIYEERGEMHKAVEAYMLAAHMSKRDWPLWKRVAKMAAENGQLEHATYCWTKVLLAEPDNTQVRMERSVRTTRSATQRRQINKADGERCAESWLVSFLPGVCVLILNRLLLDAVCLCCLFSLSLRTLS